MNMETDQQRKPLGFVWVSETYEVTWRVPRDKAQDFVNKRRSKKDDFQKQEQDHKPEKVEQNVHTSDSPEGLQNKSGEHE